MDKYNHQEIETKWQKYWAENNIYKTDLDGALLPFYNLMMFPYPSAEGLHIGGMFTFTGVDSFGRYKRMKGFNVFEPMGLDAFGIHSENYAIKIKEHIKTVSQRTEKHFYEQMHMMGNMFDWDHKLETNKEDYYKWTQWLFIQLFKSGLAYRKEAIVKFCPSCKTVVSDEQVIDGKCERCGTVVIDKDLVQWFFKITKYADRLYENLKKINWDSDVKLGQQNWIHKSQGVEYKQRVKDLNIEVASYDSVPQTFTAQTFAVIAPEHPLVKTLVEGTKYEKDVMEFVDTIVKKKAAQKYSTDKDVDGIFTGRYIEDPFGKGDLPIWVASYAIYEYGSGVVNCSAHDERDFAFAKKYDIPLRATMLPKDPELAKKVQNLEVCYSHAEDGILQDPVEFKGMLWGEAREAVIDYIVKKGYGKRATHFHLRDWCVSRQRYWGPPIPMIYCEKCASEGKSWFTENVAESHKDMTNEELELIKAEMKGWFPDESLPVKLPEIESLAAIMPDGSGKGPLASRSDFVNTTCPLCGGPAKRETDVSDPFVDSCWYFLRYPFTDFAEIPFGGDFDGPRSMFKPEISETRKKQSIARMKKWGPVNSYIGGKEHTVLHLLYARFITMALHDLGYLDFEEPFTKFYGHGLITKDGAKMSKSKGNVVNPDEYIAKYGADSIRLYLRFIGPFGQAGDWRDTGMDGMHRFVKKLWKIFQGDLADVNFKPAKVNNDESKIHKTIKEVGEDMENLRFNTAVALLMEYVNWYQDNKEKFTYEHRKKCLEVLALILAPMAPHISEEFWAMLGNEGSIHTQKWPEFDEEKTTSALIKVAIQINGKFRGTVEVEKGTVQAEVETKAKDVPNVSKYLEKGIIKVIFVPDKVISFIVPA